MFNSVGRRPSFSVGVRDPHKSSYPVGCGGLAVMHDWEGKVAAMKLKKQRQLEQREGLERQIEAAHKRKKDESEQKRREDNEWERRYNPNYTHRKQPSAPSPTLAPAPARHVYHDGTKFREYKPMQVASQVEAPTQGIDLASMFASDPLSAQLSNISTRPCALPSALKQQSLAQRLDDATHSDSAVLGEYCGWSQAVVDPLVRPHHENQQQHLTSLQLKSKLINVRKHEATPPETPREKNNDHHQRREIESTSLLEEIEKMKEKPLWGEENGKRDNLFDPQKDPEFSPPRKVVEPEMLADTVLVPIEKEKVVKFKPPVVVNARRPVEKSKVGTIGEIRFSGTVFELLTDTDIVAGGQSLAVSLSEGSFSPHAVEALLDSLTTTSSFGSLKHLIMPKQAWTITPTLLRCHLQPCPTYSTLRDDVVTLRPVPEVLVCQGVAIMQKNTPFSFTVRCTDPEGCM